MSRVLVQRPMNKVATALPQKLTRARHSDMNLSIPKINMMPLAGMWPAVLSVAVSAMKPPPATPAAPLDVSSMIARSPICWPIDRCVLVAWAMNMADRER